ncbi:MAG: hypothetical protein PHC62_01955 [Candidatus Izemoplasmatales bacterium]|nr:hypothetical protein [Candidatus Izemoplasmatales bacterium]
MRLKEFKQTINDNARFNIPKNQEFIDQISQIETTYLPKYQYRFPMRRILTGVFSLVFLTIFAFGIWINQNVVSSITLDINPSIELSLNTFGKVVHITASNEDGEYLISQTKFSGMKYPAVISSLYDECITLGFATEETGYLLLGISSSDYDDEQILQTNISNVLSNNSVNVLYINKHSQTANVLYSGFVYFSTQKTTASATGSEDITTTMMTTTIANDQNNYTSEIPSYQNSVEAVYTHIYTYLANSQYLSSDYFISIAESLGISEAKLQICMTIYVNNTFYQTEDGIITLANLSLQELFALYELIPS